MSDDDLIRRGDAVVAAQACPDSHWGPQIAAAIADLPTVTVGVRPLVWHPENDGIGWCAECPIEPSLFYFAETVEQREEVEKTRATRILAALDLTPAPDAPVEIDMRAVMMERIEEAASQSPWVPAEYSMSEVVSDCCAFLREPRKPAPDAAALVDQVRFLAERLREWEGDYINHDEAGTQWIGNVIPPLVRLEAILALLPKGGA